MTLTPAVRACKRCAFYDASEAARGQPGVCRRLPPQLVVVPQQDALGRTGVGIMSQFPAVAEASWCGEFSLLMGMSVPS